METRYIKLDYPARDDTECLSKCLRDSIRVVLSGDSFCWEISQLNCKDHIQVIKKERLSEFGILATSISEVEPFVKLSTPQYRIARKHRYNCHSYSVETNHFFQKKILGKSILKTQVVLIHFGILYDILQQQEAPLLFSNAMINESIPLIVHDDGYCQFNRITVEDISDY